MLSHAMAESCPGWILRLSRLIHPADCSDTPATAQRAFHHEKTADVALVKRLGSFRHAKNPTMVA
jgi:hypothetical protein